MEKVLNSPDISPENIEKIKSENKKFFFKTNFNFLREHNGFREGAIHLLMGTASGGKSTLRNTIMLDFLEANKNKNIFLYLSEETVRDFEKDLADCSKLLSVSERIIVFSEQDNISEIRIQDDGASFLSDKIAVASADLFIFDNITTSQLYGEDFKAQSKFILDLKANIQAMKATALIIGHTGSTVKAGNTELIDQNDFRGAKTIVNVSQFLYVMQTYSIDKYKVTTLRITKHRGFTLSNPFFMLKYSKEKRIYEFDVALTFEEVNELYQKQNRFTRVASGKKASY